MKEEEIQQALIRLEKLHQSGHLSRAMFVEKRNALLAKSDAATSGSISRSDILKAPNALAPPLGPFPDESFSPAAEKLTTRHLPVADSPMRLSSDHIENLVDRQTAAEIRALRAKPKTKPPLLDPRSREPMPPEHAPYEHRPHQAPARHSRPARDVPDQYGRNGGMDQHYHKEPLPSQHNQPGPHNMQPTAAEMEASPPFAGDILRGRYRLIRLLGTGGMGKVFLVEDERFGGQYAAKILHPWVVQHEPTISRFVQEFKMMEQLSHHGIVRTFVLDEDVQSQSLFYLMEFVEGKTLQDVLERAISSQDGPPFTGEETLLFLEKLADILCYTHDKHVLHRDLKPTNIMLYQSSQSEYGLKLLDFGLAKWIHEKEDPSLHTGHAGTFFYIAPEQLMGGAAALVAADVFSLGVVLYQMLTGALPVAMAVPPSEVNPALPSEIDQVMRKAMHANWQQRHQSVNELLDDFRDAFGVTAAHFAGQPHGSSGTHSSIRDLLSAGDHDARTPREPAKAEPQPKGERRNKANGGWSRHPSPASSRKKAKKSQPPPASLHPKASSHAAQISNADRIAKLRRSGRTDSPGGGGKPAPKSRRPRPTSTTIERVERVRKSRAASSSPPINTGKATPRSRNRRKQPTQERERFASPLQSFRAHDAAGVSVVVSSNGKFLATAGADRNIHLWDTSSWFKLHTIESKHQITSMLWSPRDDSIAFGTDVGAVQIWKTLTAQRIQAFKHLTAVRALAWLPGGSHVLCGCEDASITPWDIRSGKQEQLIHTRHPNVRALAIDSGGFLLASASSSQPIKVWNLARHSLLLELSSQDNELLTSLCFSPVDTILASGCLSGALQLWEIQSGTVRYTPEKHSAAVTCVAFAPDGTWFATGSEDQTVCRWDVASGRLLQTYHGHDNNVRSICISPDGQWLASFCEAGQVRVWEVASLS